MSKISIKAYFEEIVVDRFNPSDARKVNRDKPIEITVDTENPLAYHLLPEMIQALAIVSNKHQTNRIKFIATRDRDQEWTQIWTYRGDDAFTLDERTFTLLSDLYFGKDGRQVDGIAG